MGRRTATQGYGADAVRQKYTKYERDNETGLDFNRYSYVGNNPVNRTDSTGMDWQYDASQRGVSNRWSFMGEWQTEMAGPSIGRGGNWVCNPIGGPEQKQESLGDPPKLFFETLEAKERFEAAWKEMDSKFQNNPAAVKMFGGWDKIKKAVKEVVFTMSSMGAPFADNDNSVTNAQYDSSTDIIFINLDGAFMATNGSLKNTNNVSVPVGFYTTLPGKKEPVAFAFANDVTNAAFILFHEIAHKRKIIGHDGESERAQGKNNEKLLRVFDPKRFTDLKGMVK